MPDSVLGRHSFVLNEGFITDSGNLNSMLCCYFCSHHTFYRQIAEAKRSEPNVRLVKARNQCEDNSII